MNASDARNEAAIEKVAGRASVSHTLGDPVVGKGFRRALILLDEADCLTGRLTEAARSRPPPAALGDFLRGRYGSVDALNSAWGLVPKAKPKAFEDWASVPRSPGNAGWARSTRRSSGHRGVEVDRAIDRPFGPRGARSYHPSCAFYPPADRAHGERRSDPDAPLLGVSNAGAPHPILSGAGRRARVVRGASGEDRTDHPPSGGARFDREARPRGCSGRSE